MERDDRHPSSSNHVHAPFKVTVVFGTRPETIKLAPVVRALKAHPAFDCRVCVTGQHREMLDQALDAFGLVPDADLGLMRPDQTLAELTAGCVQGLDRDFERERPDLVLVQGDTTTAFTAALAGYYRRVAVGHVEAGLRTGDLNAPWPEEGNRSLIARLARLHFAPTENSRRNLLAEGVPADRVVVTGNTGIDALFLALETLRAASGPPTVPGLPDTIWQGQDQDQDQDRGPADRRDLVLITIHRRESFGAGLEAICQAIATLAERFPATSFVYPMHLNPNVRAAVQRVLGRPAVWNRNVHLIEPVGYLAFVALLDRSALVLTDSGGIQEEAPSLGKPVLVLRA